MTREQALRAAEVSRLVGDGNYHKLMRLAVKLTAEQLRAEIDAGLVKRVQGCDGG